MGIKGVVAFHIIAGVQENIITLSLWALCVYEVIEQFQIMINLYLQKDIHTAVRTFKLVKVIFTMDTESYLIVMFFRMEKSSPQKFQVTGSFFVAFLKANYHFRLKLNQKKPYPVFTLAMPQGN